VGSFTHVVALQGTNYSCELEVYADGYSMKFVSASPSVCVTVVDYVVWQTREPIRTACAVRPQTRRRFRADLQVPWRWPVFLRSQYSVYLRRLHEKAQLTVLERYRTWSMSLKISRKTPRLVKSWAHLKVCRPPTSNLTSAEYYVDITDACRTYELTWAIRQASERSRQQKLDASKAAADKQKVEHASA